MVAPFLQTLDITALVSEGQSTNLIFPDAHVWDEYIVRVGMVLLVTLKDVYLCGLPGFLALSIISAPFSVAVHGLVSVS
jgi:hypothetical protein